jgi:valyl-tRNA synthetase
MSRDGARRIADETAGAVLPCPNPTGQLHMGHALNLTIQDTICRWRRLRGAEIYWAGAVDHGATATEFVVRKMLRERNVDTSAWTKGEWKKAIGGWFDEITPKIYRQFQALNLSMDVREFRAMNDTVRLLEFDSCLGELTRAGLTYRGKAVVPWCAELKTTVDKADVVAEAAPLREHAMLYMPEHAGAVGVIVWVEHPETMADEVALVVSSKHALAAAEPPQFVINPIGLRLPLVVDDELDSEADAGFAKRVVPGHCATSFRWAARHGYVVGRAYDENNLMETAAYRGKTRSEARQAILKTAAERHQYGGARERSVTRQLFRLSGHPVEELLTEQYFIKTGPLAQGALRLLKSGGVRVHPRACHEMLELYMEQIVYAKREALNSEFADDWCISQQTKWGAPLNPCVLGEPDRGDAPAGPIASMKLSCAVWAFSANRVFAETREEWMKLAKGNVMVTGIDLMTWWIAPIIMVASALDVGSPAREVIVHPIVCDAAGRKMSKSLGNVITPNDLIETYGSDALRLALLSSLDLKDNALAFDQSDVGKARALLDQVRRTFSAMPARSLDPRAIERNDVARQAMAEIEEAFSCFDFKAITAVIHRVIRRMLECRSGNAEDADLCRSLLPLLEPFAPGLVRDIGESVRAESSLPVAG